MPPKYNSISARDIKYIRRAGRFQNMPSSLVGGWSDNNLIWGGHTNGGEIT